MNTFGYSAVYETYGPDLQSGGNWDGNASCHWISHVTKTRNCERANKSSAFNKTSLSMCELWDLFNQCCCGDRPRTPDPRECGADFVISVSPMSPGKKFARNTQLGTVSIFRAGFLPTQWRIFGTKFPRLRWFFTFQILPVKAVRKRGKRTLLNAEPSAGNIPRQIIPSFVVSIPYTGAQNVLWQIGNGLMLGNVTRLPNK